MTPRRLLVGFIVRLLVVYGVLMAAWPLLRHVYTPAFQAVASAWFDSFGNGGSATFRAVADPKRMSDTNVLLRDTRTRAECSYRVSSWYLGYVPTSAVIALVLAVPVGWARRLRALLWGLLLVNLYVAVRLAISLGRAFSENAGSMVVPVGETFREILKSLNGLFVQATIGGFLAPLVIWALVTFRRGDRALLLDEPAVTNPAK